MEESMLPSFGLCEAVVRKSLRKYLYSRTIQCLQSLLTQVQEMILLHTVDILYTTSRRQVH